MRPLNVFVYGGGPARELIPHVAAGTLRPNHFVSRQSLISAMSGASGALVASTTISSAENRLVSNDIRGSLLDDVTSWAAGTDVLLWDLFDERFGVDILSDGTYVTRSPERIKHVRISDGQHRHIPFGTEEHYEIWRAAADRYVQLLADNGLLSRTYVLDIRWAALDETGADAELPFGFKSYEANSAFAPYINHLRVAGVKVLTHTETWTSRAHKWGAAPYNFHDEVYRAVAAKLVSALEEAGLPQAQEASARDERHNAAVYNWAAIEDFAASREGRIHHVVAPAPGQQYELRSLIQNNGSDTLLVISHGALPRTKYSLPRFEWLASLEGRPENLMFLADTALDPFDELELAWFTGDAADDLTKRYADLVARAAKQLAVKKILFMGGSGGGFASLALAAQSPGSRALVFNPQTNIRKYWNKAVASYVGHLFPELSSAVQLKALGARTDVTANYLLGKAINHQVVYVQNDDDGHHIERHLGPFAAAVGLKAVSGVSADGNIRLIVDRFATGHNMPYRTVLNPFVDVALAGWGQPLSQNPSLPENIAVAKLTADAGGATENTAGPKVQSSGKKLIWMDTILCDAESDPTVIDRYLKRFMLTLKSIGHQRLPKDTDFRLVVHLSYDKAHLAPIIQAALDSLPNDLTTSAKVHLYEHPAHGYGVPAGSHVDLIKNPNKQPGRRENLFRASSNDVEFSDFDAVIRISMDDDDLYLPGHLEQVSSIAATLLHDSPDIPSAAGLYQCHLAHIGDASARMDHVSFSRVIPGNKFFVIPKAAYQYLADYSPWSIPELIDDESAESFLKRGIKLTLARNSRPTFVYMRRALNLSGQSKAHFIDAIHESRNYVDESELFLDVVSEDAAPSPLPQWHLEPLPRTLRLSCQRTTGDVIRAETNFSRMYGPGHEIAYYLLEDGVRVDTKWYSSDNTVNFTAPSNPCTVRAFVRRNGEIVDRIFSRRPL